MKLIKNLFIVLIILLTLIGACFLWMTSLSVSGESMEPTFHNGDRLFSNFFDTPEINDVIIFDCLSKCTNDGNLITLIKRLDKINDQGCYWVEGDNKNHSFDSRNYGWLCPSDIAFARVVIFKL